MANTYQNNTNKKLLKSFAQAFDSSTVLLNTVSKQLVNDFDPSTGSEEGAVSMKRPPQYVPIRTADGDMTGLTNPVKTGKVQASVSDFITVFVENTQVEEALETDQLDELLKPIAEDMVVELESETASFMAENAALISGDPAESINKWSDVANAGAFLKDIGAPNGKKYGVIDCFDEAALADLQSQLGVNPEASSAWAQAMIKKNFAGLDVLTTNNLPEYTTGDVTGAVAVAATPTATYASVANTYRQAIALSGFGAGGTLAPGTTLSFTDSPLINLKNRKQLRRAGAAVPLTLTVLPNPSDPVDGIWTADGSGNMTVTLSGAGIFEAGVDGAFNTVSRAITIGDPIVIQEAADTIYRPGLAYSEGFVGVGSVVLPKLHAQDSMVMNHKGSSIRVTKGSDIVVGSNQYRFDILPTFACFNPFWGLKVYGSA